jgi:hypothetical protein
VTALPAFASVEAERAILGGALLDSTLIATAGGLRPGDLELTRFRRQSRYAATFAAAYCFSKSIGLR